VCGYFRGFSDSLLAPHPVGLLFFLSMQSFPFLFHSSVFLARVDFIIFTHLQSLFYILSPSPAKKHFCAAFCSSICFQGEENCQGKSDSSTGRTKILFPHLTAFHSDFKVKVELPLCLTKYHAMKRNHLLN